MLEEIRFFCTDFEKAKFRINIYNIKKGKPHEVINKKMIYKSIYDEFKGWVSVDISDLQMSVDEDIIVGIEWIEHSNNGKIFIITYDCSFLRLHPFLQVWKSI